MGVFVRCQRCGGKQTGCICRTLLVTYITKQHEPDTPLTISGRKKERTEQHGATIFRLKPMSDGERKKVAYHFRTIAIDTAATLFQKYTNALNTLYTPMCYHTYLLIIRYV